LQLLVSLRSSRTRPESHGLPRVFESGSPGKSGGRPDGGQSRD
jgi:hypothetical protein